MNKAILHISDLHVSLDELPGGGKNTIDSFLTTKTDESDSIHFIDKFIANVQEAIQDAEITLLVTGDITDKGEKKEFKFAYIFLNRIISKLNINKSNILLIPGDHDLNRRAIQNLYDDEENPSIDRINVAKFKHFTDFYHQILEKEFDPNQVIFDKLVFDDKILLLGVNSSFEIDLNRKEGFIPIQKFEAELSSIIEKIKLPIIVCLHHNITSNYENKNDGQWETNNRQHFINKLNEHNIGFIFCGNEHTCGAKYTQYGHILTVDAGPLTSVKNDATFKIYDLKSGNDTILNNHIYSLHKTGLNDNKYEWDVRTNTKFQQDKEFVLFKKSPPELENEVVELTSTDRITNIITHAPNISDTDECNKESTNRERIYYHSPEYSDLLYSKVKELKIFHSGHYHWSETSRAHNWIDVSKLIETNKNLAFASNAIVDIIQKFKLENEIDLIIGLGYEGNLISTMSTIKFNKPYSFLPYSYRYDEHHRFETFSNFNNDSNTYKSILIITDVVNDGRTIRKLIDKREKAFFKNVTNIYVISLFYTGQADIDENILNSEFLKGINQFDFENDHEVNNIKFYTVKSLKVEKCPYGKDFREQCFIYKDELNCVNMFYDEGKYLDKIQGPN